MKFGSFKDVEYGISEIAKREAKIAKAEALMNKQITAIREKFDAETSEMRDEANALRTDIEAFCLSNKQEFQKVRSKEFSNGELGFRINPPKVTQLNRKYSVKTSIELIKRIFKGAYIRIKEELDKDSILADYSQKKVDDGELASVGLKIDQEESFFLNVKWEKFPEKVTV